MSSPPRERDSIRTFRSRDAGDPAAVAVAEEVSPLYVRFVPTAEYVQTVASGNALVVAYARQWTSIPKMHHDMAEHAMSALLGR